MTSPRCPACAKDSVTVLPHISDFAAVTYYRCTCGHVWNAAKGNPTRIHHVTPLPGHVNGRPLPFTCPTCGALLAFDGNRVVVGDQREPYRVEIYLCSEHGLFRFSKYDALVPTASDAE